MKGLDTFGAVVKYLSQDIWYRGMFGGCELLGTGVESYSASNSDLVPVPRPNQGVSLPSHGRYSESEQISSINYFHLFHN